MEKNLAMIKGILPINKPKDWTSFDVVNKVKHLLNIKKVGHLGTLDPMATGLLLVTIGKATKLFDFMQEKSKTYLATFKFGLSTDTLDITGKIVATSPNIPTRNEIESVLPKFIGDIEQVPPKYSAKSINGKRAYDLARENIDFELKPKIVKIESIDIVSYADGELTLNITCGSGTYIRSIGRDIATELNSCATMTNLVRTNIGKFSLKDSHEIDELDKTNIQDKILKIRDCLDLKVLDLDEKQTEKLLNGQVLNLNYPNGYYLLNSKEDACAILTISNFMAKMEIYLL